MVHAVLSVTKSLVGCVAGILLDRGVLGRERARRPTTSPSWPASGYAGATVRHLLDMRSGVRFLEDYTDPERRDPARWSEWLLGERGLYGYLPTLGAERPHGGHFLYRSSETDVLGWVCERASGSRMAELIAELVWAPMGAAQRRGDHVRPHRHRGPRRRAERDRPRPPPVRAAAAERRRGARPRWRQSRGSSATLAAPGVGGRRRRPLGVHGVARGARPSPAAGTGTSSGSVSASTAMCCCAWGSTGSWCTSAAVPTRSA